MAGPRFLLFLLAATLTASGPSALGHGSRGFPRHEAEPTGRADLSPVAGSPQPDARGTVELGSSGRGDRLTVAVVHAAPSTPLVLLVDDGTGTLVESGALAPRCLSVEIVFETGEGDALPAGAASAADLAGRRLEVREEGGAAVLSGMVPVPAVPSGSAGSLRDLSGRGFTILWNDGPMVSGTLPRL